MGSSFSDCSYNFRSFFFILKKLDIILNSLKWIRFNISAGTKETFQKIHRVNQMDRVVCDFTVWLCPSIHGTPFTLRTCSLTFFLTYLTATTKNKATSGFRPHDYDYDHDCDYDCDYDYDYDYDYGIISSS